MSAAGAGHFKKLASKREAIDLKEVIKHLTTGPVSASPSQFDRAALARVPTAPWSRCVPSADC